MNAVRVLVDAHMLGHRETGNETYVRGLLAGLASLGGVTVAAAVSPDHQVDRAWHDAITWLYLPTSSSVSRLSGNLAELGRRWNADVLHATYIAPYRSHCPVVISVHDVSFKRFPEYFSWRDRVLFSTLLPSSLRRAAAILTLSSHARDELQRYYPDLRTPIHVVPAAPHATFRPIDVNRVAGTLARLHIQRPFLVAVGSVQPRKNLARLIEAFADVRRRHADLQLAIVGPSGFRASTLEATIVGRGLGHAVRLLGYVSEEDLVAVYNAAVALVYPSVYEGFGLPVVEAMACGRPVIAANTSSLPEVAGDAALLVVPFDVSALAAAMDQLLADPRAAEDLGARGLAHVARFSWQRTASTALAAFEAARRASVA
jgi:glycosyltransferase involved in cell wall biosynthesis